MKGFRSRVSPERRTVGFESRERTYVRRNGTRLIVDLTVTPIRGEAGAITGYLGIVEDVSARKAADAMRSQVIHHVNHELRTPLNVLILGLALLEEDVKGKLPPEDERYLRLACEGATHLNRMVADLLDVARSESGKLSVTPETFDLAATTASVVDGFRPLAVERGVALALSGEGAPRPVHAEP